MNSKNNDYWFLPPTAPNVTLKNLRKFSGLRQEEVCKILNITQGHLSKLESGELGLRLSIDQFLKISTLYNVSLDQIDMGFVPLDNVMKFHGKNVLPSKFIGNYFTTMKSAYPFIMALQDYLGKDVFLKELKKSKIQDWWLFDPQLPVNSVLFFEIIRIASKIKNFESIKSEFFDKVVEHSIDPKVFGSQFEKLISKKFKGADIVVADLLETILFQKQQFFQIQCDSAKKELNKKLTILLEDKAFKNKTQLSFFDSYLQKLVKKMSESNQEIKELFYANAKPRFQICSI